MTTQRSNANRLRPLSSLLPGITKTVLGSKNLLFGKMVAEWRNIAGEDISAQATPVEIKFARTNKKKGKNKPGQAILHLAVAPAFALEFSYQKTLLIERLNMFFGYAAIKDIKIIQQEITLHNEKKVKEQGRPLTAEEDRNIDIQVEGIAGDELQTALKNLGKAITSHTIKEE